MLTSIPEGFEALNIFETQIAHAKMSDTEFVEVSPELFAYFTKGVGTGKAPYFWYKDVKVVKHGDIQSAQEVLNIDSAQFLHGKNEGIVEGR